MATESLVFHDLKVQLYFYSGMSCRHFNCNTDST